MQPCWPPAVAQRRALVTENVAECVELHRTAAITGRRHFGLVFTSARGFPRTTRAIGRLVRALDALLDAHRTDDALATRPGGWSRPESSKAFCPRRAQVAAAPRWPPRHQMRLSRAFVKLHHPAEGRHAPARAGLSVASGAKRQLAGRIPL